MGETIPSKFTPNGESESFCVSTGRDGRLILFDNNGLTLRMGRHFGVAPLIHIIGLAI
jgi:hypothetical protein